jgi:DNA-directed RNA polymerase specialized sigma24 family protein
MADTSTNTRHWLIQHCTWQFVKSVLQTGRSPSAAVTQEAESNPPAGYCLIIRSIVLRNILRGRVARHMHRQHAGLTDHWLADYIRLVERHYRADRDEWLSFQSPAGCESLYNLFFKFACGHVKALHLVAYGIDAREVAHEAWYQNPKWLHDHPFDLPLHDWLDRRVHVCACQLNHMCPQDIGLSSFQEMPEEDVPATSATHEGHGLDDMIDLKSTMSKLTQLNQQVLTLWYQGYSLQESSHRLNLTPKAVANRRNRIQQQIRSASMQ